MKRKIKYGKIALVVLITGLIWVWTDRRLDDQQSLPSVTVRIAKSVDPGFWISFKDDQSSASVQNIVLRGPASNVEKLRQQLSDGRFNSEFIWYPEKKVMDEPRYDLSVADFLRQSEQIKQLALSVESCDPTTLQARVVKLVDKTLTVECRDENGRPLKAESINPPTVTMPVPKEWEGEALTAYVQLTGEEVKQARLQAAVRKPCVDLAPGEKREAPDTVEIRMPPEEDPRSVHSITATIGFVFSANLQGKFTVKLNNEAEVMRDISIKATPAAKEAYEREPFKIILYILDDDKKTTEQQEREVVYTFPEEFVRKDEIMLNQQAVTAKFQVVPVPPASPS